jgi:uncharacterized glyoxalase superfamily protein PhnB
VRGAGLTRSATAERPIDRLWGVRTASFSDPGGHIWEIAKVAR